MSDVTPDAADLENLPSKELHGRAMRLARDRRDVGFLWELLRSIPAAAASTGETERARFDLLHGLSLLEEFTHAGEGDLADALRPVYVAYLTGDRPSGSEESGTEEPGAEESGTQESGTGESGTGESGTGESGTGQSAAGET